MGAKRALESLQYFEMPTPLGPLTGVLTSRGLAWLHFGKLSQSKRNALAHAYGAAACERVRGSRAEKELRAYFKSGKARFRAPLDLSGLPPFSRKILTRLAKLPSRKFTSYGALAKAAGSPGAARAVGQAVGANPIPIVIPCHRVIAGDGSLGGYSGGLTRKRALLKLEGIAPPAGGWPPRRRV